MTRQRNWGHFLPNLKNELNSFSGIMGFGFGVLSIISLFGAAALQNAIVQLFAMSGIGISVVAFAKAALDAIPPKLHRPEDLVGKQLQLERLREISGELKKVCIVGPTKAGKSTLISAIINQRFTPQRTSGLHAYIAVLPISPVKYYVMLDGSGGEFSDQFEIARHADFIFVILDHDEGDADFRIDPARLIAANNFTSQLIGFLNNHKKCPTKWIHLLLNKRDLWGNLDTPEIQELQKFLEEEHKKWMASKVATEVTKSPHSNFKTEDIGKLVRLISAHA